jgi:hypothetical protein
VQTGFIVEEKLAEGISMKAISENSQGKTLLTVTVTNDYFLPRSYALPQLTSCLYDSSGKNQGQNVYARWGTISNVLYPGADILLIPSQDRMDVSGLDLNTNDKKSAYFYTTSFYSSSIWRYDKLLLLENKDVTDYNLCYTISPAQVAIARSIPLIDDLGYTCPTVTSLNCRSQSTGYCDYRYQDWIRSRCPGVTIVTY